MFILLYHKKACFVNTGFVKTEICMTESFQWDVFAHSTISKLYIPSSITYIPKSYFNDAEISEVYYSGTKTDWTKIDIGNYNDALLNAEIHCSDGDFDLIPLKDGFWYTYDLESSTLTIYGEGEMPADLEINAELELPYIVMLKVIISDEITVVDGISSFTEDLSLYDNVTYYLPASVTEIRDGMFIDGGEPGGHIVYEDTV